MPGTKLHREHILASSFLVRSFFSTFCEGPGLVWYLHYPGMKVGVTSLQDTFKWLHKADLQLSKVTYSNCTALCYVLILNTHGTSQRYTSILHWHIESFQVIFRHPMWKDAISPTDLLHHPLLESPTKWHLYPCGPGYLSHWREHFTSHPHSRRMSGLTPDVIPIDYSRL